MSKVSISEEDLLRMLEDNPELELDGADAVGTQPQQFKDEEWGEYVPRPITILSFDDYKVSPYVLPVAQRRDRSWLKTIGNLYPARAWILLAFLLIVFWDQMFASLVIWFILVNLTPILDWSK